MHKRDIMSWMLSHWILYILEKVYIIVHYAFIHASVLVLNNIFFKFSEILLNKVVYTRSVYDLLHFSWKLANIVDMSWEDLSESIIWVFSISSLHKKKISTSDNSFSWPHATLFNTCTHQAFTHFWSPSETFHFRHSDLLLHFAGYNSLAQCWIYRFFSTCWWMMK